jgi:hypothetical protein
VGGGKRDVHKIINFYLFMINYPANTGESHPPHPCLPLPAGRQGQAGSSCLGEVDKSSFYISPHEPNSNAVSDIIV